MSTRFRHSISFRAGLIILLAAALLTFVLSVFFYQRIVSEQIQLSRIQIRQLVQTVESSAAVAAYLENHELANEVVKGLANNDIVAGVVLTASESMNISSGATDSGQKDDVLRFSLKSPFMREETIGEIRVLPNEDTIEQRATEVANVYILTLAGYSLGLTLLVMGLIFGLLSRPIKALANRLHEIKPGGEERLSLPSGHRDDEVGQLVTDINFLLQSVQVTLEEERHLRHYVESVEKRFRLIFEKASCGIVLMDCEGLIRMSNGSFKDLFPAIFTTQENGEGAGEAAREVNFADLFEDRQLVTRLLFEVEKSESMSQDLQLAKKQAGNGRWLHTLFSPVQDEQGERLVECIVYDISERTRREQQIRQEAERDPLTLLLNRRAGERLMEIALHKSLEENTLCALMVIDLDRFKPINDTHGHEAGDAVLVSVAERMRSLLRQDDLIVRWGGDEFVVLASPGSRDFAVSAIAEKLLEKISMPVRVSGIGELTIGASIGVSLFPDHEDDLAELIKKADQAMYEVKQTGRNGFKIYQQEISTKAV